MTEEHLNKHKAELQAQVDAAATACAERKLLINNLSINLQNIRGELARLSAVISNIPPLSRQLVSIQQRANAHVAAVKNLQDLRVTREKEMAAHTETEKDLKADIARVADIVTDTRSRLPVVNELLTQKSQLESTSNELTGKVSRLRTDANAVRHRHSLAQFQVKEKERLTFELSKIADQLVSGKVQRDAYTELVKAFGPTGIPTLILENCLTELQQYLDHYMGILSDGKIHVTFQTVKTNATTAKTSETLNILVSDVSGERDIALYSGGETVRIYLAIRLALAKLLYLKSGYKFGLMIIDEIADLDDAGLTSFVELLKRIEPEHEQILLVSHLPELKAAFDNSLVLSRDIEGNYVPTA
jgi:DNA repair exonuclease SbcCD ATPase subunit